MTADEIGIFVDENLSDDPIWTVSLVIPIGTLNVMAVVRIESGCIELSGMHIGGDPAVEWGWSKLRLIERLVAEKVDVDEIIIVGALRTTDASPGRRPGRHRFTRASQPQTGAGRTP